MPASSTPSTPMAPGEWAALADRAHRLDHDLRTPIGTMATALDLLRGGRAAFGEDDLEALDVLQRQIDKLTSLAEVLRDFAADLDDRARNPARRD